VATGGERIPRLYTRTGDHGTTGLAHGARVDKDGPRIRAYGSLDELGAHLGRVRAELPPDWTEFRALVRRLENELYVAQTELAAAPTGPPPKFRIEARHVTGLEGEIDRWDARHPELTTFVLPGGSLLAADLHIARTVARRAERELWALNRAEPLRSELLAWTNRLSDLLFALALAANHAAGVAESPPDYSV
jgi:cob(I)alamin adenosyltransferase